MNKENVLTNNKTLSNSHMRDSNLELFRIIVMILIIAHHYVVNSDLVALDGPVYLAPLSGKSLFIFIFGAWGKIGINCFMMITGYFMCKNTISIKKFLKLLFEIVFYRLIIYALFVSFGYSSFSLIELIKVLLPINEISLDFVGCFLIFWLFIPFLNLLISHMNEKIHVRLIFLCSFLYIILGTVKQVTMNYVSWFIVLYFIASYIRLYPKNCYSNTKLWGIITIFSIVVSVISVVLGVWLGIKMNKNLRYFFVSDSNTLLAVVVGVSSFMFFKNIKIHYNKVINTIAATTFGILLIHANSDTMRQWLWKDLLDVVGHYKSSLMPLYSICCVLAIFIVCVVIDIIRINLIEKPFFRWWDKHEGCFVAKYKKIESKIFKRFNID